MKNNWEALSAGFNQGLNTYIKLDNYETSKKQKQQAFLAKSKSDSLAMENAKLSKQINEFTLDKQKKAQSKVAVYDGYKHAMYSKGRGRFDKLSKAMGVDISSISGPDNFGPADGELEMTYNTMIDSINEGGDPMFPSDDQPLVMVDPKTGEKQLISMNSLGMISGYSDDIIKQQKALGIYKKKQDIVNQSKVEHTVPKAPTAATVKLDKETKETNVYNDVINGKTKIESLDKSVIASNLDKELSIVNKASGKQEIRKKVTIFNINNKAAAYITDVKNVPEPQTNVESGIKSIWDKLNIKKSFSTTAEKDAWIDAQVGKLDKEIKGNVWISKALSQFKEALKADSGLAVSEFEFALKMKEMFGVSDITGLFGNPVLAAKAYGQYVEGKRDSLVSTADTYSKEGKPFISNYIKSSIGDNDGDENGKDTDNDGDGIATKPNSHVLDLLKGL